MVGGTRVLHEVDATVEWGVMEWEVAEVTPMVAGAEVVGVGIQMVVEVATTSRATTTTGITMVGEVVGEAGALRSMGTSITPHLLRSLRLLPRPRLDGFE